MVPSDTVMWTLREYYYRVQYRIRLPSQMEPDCFKNTLCCLFLLKLINNADQYNTKIHYVEEYLSIYISKAHKSHSPPKLN